MVMALKLRLCCGLVGVVTRIDNFREVAGSGGAEVLENKWRQHIDA